MNLSSAPIDPEQILVTGYAVYADIPPCQMTVTPIIRQANPEKHFEFVARSVSPTAL